MQSPRLIAAAAFFTGFTQFSACFFVLFCALHLTVDII
nr:MAG TPA: hypothetical protein [Caudoviricetes sp.]